MEFRNNSDLFYTLKFSNDVFASSSAIFDLGREMYSGHVTFLRDDLPNMPDFYEHVRQFSRQGQITGIIGKLIFAM